MYCANCGAQVSDQAAFCPGCGKPTTQPVSEANQTTNPAIGEMTAVVTPPPAKPKTGGKAKSFFVLLMVVALIAFGVYSMQKHPVRDLKDITFDGYGDATFGDAVSDSMRNVSWKSEKVDKTHYRVAMQGFCPEEYSNIEVVVDLNYADDYVYASVDYVTIDGDEYDSLLMISYVMDAIYGE